MGTQPTLHPSKIISNYGSVPKARSIKSVTFGIYRDTAVKHHCDDWYEMWALTDHKISVGPPLFHVSDLAPFLALSLKETTLSGVNGFTKFPTSHFPIFESCPVHNFQLGKRKFAFPAKEVAFLATFVNSLILSFRWKKAITPEQVAQMTDFLAPFLKSNSKTFYFL